VVLALSFAIAGCLLLESVGRRDPRAARAGRRRRRRARRIAGRRRPRGLARVLAGRHAALRLSRAAPLAPTPAPGAPAAEQKPTTEICATVLDETATVRCGACTGGHLFSYVFGDADHQGRPCRRHRRAGQRLCGGALLRQRPAARRDDAQFVRCAGAHRQLHREALARGRRPLGERPHRCRSRRRRGGQERARRDGSREHADDARRVRCRPRTRARAEPTSSSHGTTSTAAA